MSIFDDGSNSSLLQAALLLFITGAALSTIRAMRTVDQALAELEDDEALDAHNPWGTS